MTEINNVRPLSVEVAGTSDVQTVTRRGFLQRSWMLAGSALLLSACGPTAPGAGNGSAATAVPKQPVTAAPLAATTPQAGAQPTAAASNGNEVKFQGVVLPSYLPPTYGPQPDLPSTDPNIDPGFRNFPTNPPKVNSSTPGRGGEVSFFVGAYYPPATPLDQNPAWQEVNKQLGVTVKMNIVGLSDQNARLATMMAGDDLPDFIHMNSGWAGAANLPQFAEIKMADLTPYLSGDAIKEYPNLAALPPTAWKHTVYKGKILAVPIHRPAVSSLLFRNQTIWDQELGAGALPRNADDYRRMLVELTKPAQQRWGYGAYVAPLSGVALDIAQFARLFGTPNNWQLESDGKLVNMRETGEYKAAVAFARDLWAAGVYHPDVLNWTGVVPAQEAMIGGRTVTMSHSMAYYNDLWRRGATANPPVIFRSVAPFSPDGTSKPVYHFGTRVIGTTGLKKASPERVKELLSIMNWLAAPFGTQEAMLLEYGIPDVDYQLDERGNPRPTERGVADSAYVPWRYIAQRPFTQYQADLPGYTEQAQADTRAHVPFGIDDPTLGLYSATTASRSSVLTQKFAEGVVDLIAGRRPMNEFDALVREWQSGGGDQMRQDFQQALSA